MKFHLSRQNGKDQVHKQVFSREREADRKCEIYLRKIIGGLQKFFTFCGAKWHSSGCALDRNKQLKRCKLTDIPVSSLRFALIDTRRKIPLKKRILWFERSIQCCTKLCVPCCFCLQSNPNLEVVLEKKMWGLKR